METIVNLYDLVAAGTQAKAPVIVEVDKENGKKDLEALDIAIQVLTPRVYREDKNLSRTDAGDRV